MLQAEYYVVERENNNNYPLFSWDQQENECGLGKPVNFTEPLKFRLSEPIPPKLKWVDFHEAPDPVISLPLASLLEKLDIYGIQLIPAKVRNPKDPFSELHDYCLVHVWNRIACLDKTQSVITTNKAGDLIWGIEKFVLDEQALGKFELQNRLIFELAEKTSVLLMHQSIKDAIESINPKGIRFIPATTWNSDSTFD
jgi:hypothetical protein